MDASSIGLLGAVIGLVAGLLWAQRVRNSWSDYLNDRVAQHADELTCLSESCMVAIDTTRADCARRLRAAVVFARGAAHEAAAMANFARTSLDMPTAADGVDRYVALVRASVVDIEQMIAELQP